MLDFYNAYKEKILPFILYRFQRSIGIRACIKRIRTVIQNFAVIGLLLNDTPIKIGKSF